MMGSYNVMIYSTYARYYYCGAHFSNNSLKATGTEVKWGDSDTNFDLSGLLPPTNGQHPRCLCCRIQ